MPRNGSGSFNFTPSSWSPGVNGASATTADYNAQQSDLASALTQSVSRDGQAPYTGNQPMAGFKFTGLGAGSGSGDSVRYEQVGTLALAQGVATALRGYIDGFQMSTAGSSSTMSIGAGVAMDSTNVTPMSLTATSKTTANWVVGAAAGGKARAAAIANSTWYHFYEIYRPDTGVTDVCFSPSATGLVAADYVAGGGNVPDAYTLFRRIGSGFTNGSAQWTRFIQRGETFLWYAPGIDVSAPNPGTGGGQRYAILVPTGVVVEAVVQGGLRNLGAGVIGGVYFGPPDIQDDAPAETSGPLWNSGAATANVAGGARDSYTQNRAFTNTSAQINARTSVSDADCRVLIVTVGWVDSRGRNQ